MSRKYEELMADKRETEKSESREEIQTPVQDRVQIYGVTVSVMAVVLAGLNLLLRRGSAEPGGWPMLLVMLAILAINIAIYKIRNRER